MDSQGFEFYGRQLIVSIGNDQKEITIRPQQQEDADGLKNLKMTAKIVKDSKAKEDDFCEILIYNLKESTRDFINLENLRMTITSGYGEHVGISFYGDIQSATHIHQGNDWITKIIASDGKNALDQAIINKTYEKGTTLGQMMIDYSLTADIEEMIFKDINVDKILERGKTINQPMREALTDLSNSNNFDWAIQDGSLIAVDRKSSRESQRLIISVGSGMIGSPEWINTGTDNSQTETESGIKLKVESLHQSGVKPFDKIFVKSEALKGRIGQIEIDINPTELIGEFKVLKVTHDLDSYENDFKTTLECQYTGTEFIDPQKFDVSKMNITQRLQ